MKTFNRLPRLVQIILLLIPGVNWVTEIIVRWSAFGHSHRFWHFVWALVVTVFGLVFGWIDLLWCLFFHHILFAKGK